MAYVDQWDEEERRATQGPGSAAPERVAPNAAGPGTQPGGGGQSPAPAPGVGTGFVNLQTYLDLNRGAGQQMAEGVASGIESQGQGVMSGLQELQGDYRMDVGRGTYSGAPSLAAYSPDKWNSLTKQAGDVSARARTAGSGGVGTLIAEQAGRGGGYSSGMQGLDAFLAGAAGGNRLRATGNAFGGLDKRLTGAEAGAAGVAQKEEAANNEAADIRRNIDPQYVADRRPGPVRREGYGKLHDPFEMWLRGRA